MLEVKNLVVHYGDIEVIHNINIEVKSGSVVAFIGANGAGKTTILATICGLKKPTKGSIYFDGHDLLRQGAHKIIRLGLAHVPEGREVFGGMSVVENLEMGAYILGDKKERNKQMDQMYELFPRLFERKNQLAGTLSGGEQQMLAIARALISNPRFLLMDEPSMGLSPILVNEIFMIINKIKKMGKTVLLVEQNAKKALQCADYAYVLETGTIALEGPAKDLIDNEQIKKAYLGL